MHRMFEIKSMFGPTKVSFSNCAIEIKINVIKKENQKKIMEKNPKMLDFCKFGQAPDAMRPQRVYLIIKFASENSISIFIINNFRKFIF